MPWLVVVVGLVGCTAFCWYVLREDRRAVKAHRLRRETLHLVAAPAIDPGEDRTEPHAGAEPGDSLRDAA